MTKALAFSASSEAAAFSSILMWKREVDAGVKATGGIGQEGRHDGGLGV